MRTNRLTLTASLGLRTFAVLALLIATLLGAASSATAQGTVDVAIWTQENGNPAYDACYVLVGYSEVGCDENGDGRVMFADIPYGTYTVSQVADLGPGRYVDDFTIQVTGPGGNSEDWQSFSATIVTTGGSSSGSEASGYSDIAIVTTENGQPVYDACYVIVDYSEVGCDENGDGKITFEDIPFGVHTVRQVADLGPNRIVNDFTIQVMGAASGDGWERFPATIVSTGGSSSGASSSPGSSGSVDVALITRDPDTGELLTGACYMLVGYSNEGCDENGDGQATFAVIPFGTYTVHQTQTPAGYPSINDYEIRVEPLQAVESTELIGYPLSFVVKQAPEQNAPNTRNVSVVLIDARTNQRVQDEFCLEIVGASIEGCDRDLPDGQIDFLDVPTGGPYEINFTKIPPGYNVDLTFDGGPWLVTVNDGPADPANKMAFVFVSSPASASGTAGSDGGTGSTSGSAATTTSGLEWRTMVIGCSDPVACYGAEIVVTRDGAPVGSCTITTDPNDTSHVHACAVDVPVGVTIQLHLDESTLSPGYIATENDVSFETTYVGKRASHDFIFDVVPGDGAQGSAGTASGSSGTGSLTVYFWTPRDTTMHNSGGCAELVGSTRMLCNDAAH